MQAQISDVLNDLGFVFVGAVAQKDAYTVTDHGTLVVTDELGFAWEIPENYLHDEKKCELCGRRRYVAHLFAVQTLH